MKISHEGLKFIKSFEGLRLSPYQCSANAWTIGWGHTRKVDSTGATINGKKLPIITEAIAEDLLLEDIMQFELAVNRLVQVPLTQNQFDALVSFAFNLGAGALQKSTLLKKLNKGDYKGAAKEFKRWNKAGGRVINGLITRRKEEAEMFANDIGYEQNAGQFKPDPNNMPILYQTLPRPTAHQEYGEPVSPTNTKKNVAVAGAGIAGAGVIELINHASPAVSALSYLSWQTGVVLVIVAAIGGLIWWKWGR